YDEAIALEDELRQERRQYLGTTKGRFRAHEADAAEHLEQSKRRNFEPHDEDAPGEKKPGDWIDPVTKKTYDGVGPVPSGVAFNLGEFTAQIQKHILKQDLDVVFVDLSGRTDVEVQQVLAYIRGLPPPGKPVIEVFQRSSLP